MAQDIEPLGYLKVGTLEIPVTRIIFEIGRMRITAVAGSLDRGRMVGQMSILDTDHEPVITGSNWHDFGTKRTGAVWMVTGTLQLPTWGEIEMKNDGSLAPRPS